jgi:hypothetical protein
MERIISTLFVLDTPSHIRAERLGYLNSERTHTSACTVNQLQGLRVQGHIQPGQKVLWYRSRLLKCHVRENSRNHFWNLTLLLLLPRSM